MIKGLIVFILHFILLNPMVLIGAGAAFYLMTTFPIYVVLAYAKSIQLYGLALAISLVYVILFKHEYYSNSSKIDWKSTIKGSVGEFLSIILSAVLTGIIIYCLQEMNFQSFDNYLRAK